MNELAQKLAVWLGIIGAAASVYFPMAEKMEAAERERQKQIQELKYQIDNLQMVVTVLSAEEWQQAQPPVLNQLTALRHKVGR